MDFEYFMIVAFMFAFSLPFNLAVILFFLMARDIHDFGGRVIGYSGVFCYAFFMVVFDVIMVHVLITHAKTYIPS